MMKYTLLTILVLPLCSSFPLFGSVEQLALLTSRDYPVPGNNSFEFCEDPKDYNVEFDYLDVKPNPPKAGENVTITGSGQLHTEIKNGSTFVFDVKLKTGGVKVPLLKQEADICESMLGEDTECPLKDGPLKVKTKVEIPGGVKGTYIVTASVFDADSQEVVCVRSTVEL